MRPSTLILFALAAGGGILWASKRAYRSTSASKRVTRAGAVPKPSNPGLIRTLISVYGARLLNFVIQHGLAAWKQQAAHSTANVAPQGSRASAEASGPTGRAPQPQPARRE